MFSTIEAANKDKKQNKILQTIIFIIFWDFHVLPFFVFTTSETKRDY